VFHPIYQQNRRPEHIDIFPRIGRCSPDQLVEAEWADLYLNSDIAALEKKANVGPHLFEIAFHLQLCNSWLGLESFIDFQFRVDVLLALWLSSIGAFRIRKMREMRYFDSALLVNSANVR